MITSTSHHVPAHYTPAHRASLGAIADGIDPHPAIRSLLGGFQRVDAGVMVPIGKQDDSIRLVLILGSGGGGGPGLILEFGVAGGALTELGDGVQGGDDALADQNRLLMVTHAERGDVIRIVSARELTPRGHLHPGLSRLFFTPYSPVYSIFPARS